MKTRKEKKRKREKEKKGEREKRKRKRKRKRKKCFYYQMTSVHPRFVQTFASWFHIKRCTCGGL